MPDKTKYKKFPATATEAQMDDEKQLQLEAGAKSCSFEKQADGTWLMTIVWRGF